MESTLLRLIGALFCHDAKRARTRTGKIQLNKGADEKHIEILPHPNYGQSGPLAHKTLIALMKKNTPITASRFSETFRSRSASSHD
jgi:hypothetical protein